MRASFICTRSLNQRLATNEVRSSLRTLSQAASRLSRIVSGTDGAFHHHVAFSAVNFVQILKKDPKIKSFSCQKSLGSLGHLMIYPGIDPDLDESPYSSMCVILPTSWVIWQGRGPNEFGNDIGGVPTFCQAPLYAFSSVFLSTLHCTEVTLECPGMPWGAGSGGQHRLGTSARKRAPMLPRVPSSGSGGSAPQQT